MLLLQNERGLGAGRLWIAVAQKSRRYAQWRPDERINWSVVEEAGKPLDRLKLRVPCSRRDPPWPGRTWPDLTRRWTSRASCIEMNQVKDRRGCHCMWSLCTFPSVVCELWCIQTCLNWFGDNHKLILHQYYTFSFVEIRAAVLGICFTFLMLLDSSKSYFASFLLCNLLEGWRVEGSIVM